MEKVIREFRVIETDDGFRIEIKGDKERMRSFMHGFRGPRRFRKHFRRHRRGPFGFGPFDWMYAYGEPGEFEDDDEVKEEEEDE